MLAFDLRPINKKDQEFLWQMLHIAAHCKESGESIQYCKENPDIARYASDWGRPGDFGQIALHEGKAVGAVWARLWSKSDHGFGFLDENTPEIAIGITEEYQNHGLGTILIHGLFAQSLERVLTLNVRKNNPAHRLYKRIGFVEIEDSECVNRVGGTSVTMKVVLPSSL